MNRRKWILRSALAIFCGAIIVISANNLPAGFNSGDQVTYVEIDGINYGAFSQVSGLESVSFHAQHKGTEEASYGKVSLGRDFVTEPSLYLWAKNMMSKQSILKNIRLVTYDQQGNELFRRVLHFCQPLSWAVEAANQGLGGFHERIELAVQEISLE